MRSVSIFVTFGVNQDVLRELLGTWESPKEDKAGWGAFLVNLKERGLSGTQLFVSDKCMGLVESLSVNFPGARWQRFVVHFYRNILNQVPSTKIAQDVPMLKAVGSWYLPDS